jgi:hypothetical protein
MKKIAKEVFEELLMIFTGKSLDIIVPPVLFLLLYRMFDLKVALIGSIILSLGFLLSRIYKKENLYYALGGFIGVLFAVIMSYINQNASNFFLPDIIGTSFLVIVTIITLAIKKPLAAFVSHITRGWSLEWFYRDDVLPAYKEVTIFWLGFFVLRLGVEIILYLKGSIDDLVIANIVLGFPITIAVLTISYIYGIWRLHNLEGPGVDEFKDNKEPPWRGQTRGF